MIKVNKKFILNNIIEKQVKKKLKNLMEPLTIKPKHVGPSFSKQMTHP